VLSTYCQFCSKSWFTFFFLGVKAELIKRLETYLASVSSANTIASESENAASVEGGIIAMEGEFGIKSEEKEKVGEVEEEEKKENSESRNEGSSEAVAEMEEDFDTENSNLQHVNVVVVPVHAEKAETSIGSKSVQFAYEEVVSPLLDL
jgi:hypothetical protein